MAKDPCHRLVAIYWLPVTRREMVLAVRNLSLTTVATIAIALAGVPMNCLAESSTPHVLFPPVDCVATELRVIAWQDGAASTKCVTAQQILKLALPGCQAGQQIAFNGANFVCDGTSVSNGKAAK
jgi:hypothetical protein